ncbi:MAG: DsbA family protein [Deltaproteobacteria bacterium]|nr:DsbA family protein [Deltaproteobacteria bacterium]
MQFYFDPLSPWVYLAFKRIQLLKKLGLSVQFVPVSIFILHSFSPEGTGCVSYEHLMQEIDEMKKEPYPFVVPTKFPFNTVLAQRLCVALENESERQILEDTLIESAWGKGLNLENEDHLKMIVLSLGINAEELWEKAFMLEAKELLKHHSLRALQLGIHELPALRVGDQIIQGKECLVFLDKTLLEYSEFS